MQISTSNIAKTNFPKQLSGSNFVQVNSYYVLIRYTMSAFNKLIII